MKTLQCVETHKEYDIKFCHKSNGTNIKEFLNWILKIGDGDIYLNENGKGNLEIPKHLLIENTESPLLSSLVKFVYPEFKLNMTSSEFFDHGAILCPIIESIEQWRT